METVIIQTNSKQYPVYIGSGVISGLKAFIEESFPKLSSILIISDQTVGELYLNSLKSQLTSFETASFIVPSGESAKSFNHFYDCLTYALEQKLDRKSLIVSFGGGVVGDLSGFVAASYMRGIAFIQVPTTILAHDSAVGGKVAINHPLGKNMIGAFHQPEAVFYDLDYLGSLPNREIRSGFAEVIKHALIQDAKFYDWLRDNVSELSHISGEILQYSLVRGIEIKGDIVSQDEKETGVRAFLNFGHTLGHAIEAECGYGEMSHGEAVVIGMVFALKLSKQFTGLKFNEEEFKLWLERIGYQVTLPEGLIPEKLLTRMKQDKKSVGQKARFVLLEQLGVPCLHEISDEQLLKSLSEF
ncbi:3-dehydroquinate synthase [Bacillus marasmi]|uniref:3-dehydroquinate synthase n=1 Tax=Bacillus marasmi TaxID=1926279 RepID=UPI0011C89537|nr:3-dehydroquinate synthase [Bacillus marasmi]